MMDDKEVLKQAARSDFFTFVAMMFEVLHPGDKLEGAAYLRLTAATIQTMAETPGSRQIVNMPPRHLKSFICAVALPAWLLGRDPSMKLMIASHTLPLSVAHVRAVRKLMKSDRYCSIFTTRLGGKDTESEIETTSGGSVLAVSFEAAPTGRGCDGLIMDDPMKADDADNPQALEACANFFFGALSSRINHPSRGFILLVMQRLAIGDLTGKLLETGAYQQLSLPLVATEDEYVEYEDRTGRHIYRRPAGECLNPGRMNDHALHELKAGLPDRVYATQFQQAPHNAVGSILKEEWFSFLDAPIPEDGTIVQSWDTAAANSQGSAYSVCLTWKMHTDRFELIDVFRERLLPNDLASKAIMLASQYRPRRVLVEQASSGYAVSVALKFKGHTVVDIMPTRSKQERLVQCLGAFQQMLVNVPKAAPWLRPYVDELVTFPSGRYSDQVDATSQFLNWAVPFLTGDRVDKTLSPRKLVTAGVSGGGGPSYRVGRGVVSSADFRWGGRKIR